MDNIKLEVIGKYRSDKNRYLVKYYTEKIGDTVEFVMDKWDFEAFTNMINLISNKSNTARENRDFIDYDIKINVNGEDKDTYIIKKLVDNHMTILTVGGE